MTTNASNERETASLANLRRFAHLDMFLISFLILFFELACIRWFGGMVVYLTFFTNIVLIACFLGMSLGCLTAARTHDHSWWVLPLALVSVCLSSLLLAFFRIYGKVIVDVGGQSSPQEVFFGTESHANDPSYFVVPIEFLAGLFFLLIALTFVGLGQVLGRAFDVIPNRLAAYTTNVLGSLGGILAFGMMSVLRSPPILWFALASMIALYFLRRLTVFQSLCAVTLVTVVGLVPQLEGRNQSAIIWSPYYKIGHHIKSGNISTNNIGHQGMVDLAHRGSAYMLPHLLNRDAGRPPFKEVLVIGAGSGNDVAAALRMGAGHVDAVDIEPVLNEIGRRDHPNLPYDDPRVTVHIDDGRSFVRKTSKRYDLIVYALVDSLVLHSGYSSLRLENFLFTEQAFEDVRAHLAPDGVFVVYNWFRQGWIIGRIVGMAKTVFESEPIVCSLPYRAKISGGARSGSFSVLFVGNPDSKVIPSLRARFQDQGYFWLNDRPSTNELVNGYGSKPLDSAGVEPGSWQKIGPAEVDPGGIGWLPTDDWPFLYLRSAAIPWLNIRGMAIIASLSLILLFTLGRVRTTRINGRMFFLGAGFMLLETKGVVHMALLFGSTWVVNSFVFAAILAILLASNILVLLFRIRNLSISYVLLAACLLLNSYVPMSYFLDLPGSLRAPVSCLVVFIPLLFAGVIFAASFRDSIRPDVDMGSNIAGVILGGLSENLSLVIGFNHLLLVALAFYMLSAVFRVKSPARVAPAFSPVAAHG
jgi:SAM-dependent methyltransferase